jgi:hypothetical protein
MIASGAWVAWSVVRRSPDEVVGGEARPRVQLTLAGLRGG